jgi:hypothetical protein
MHRHGHVRRTGGGHGTERCSGFVVPTDKERDRSPASAINDPMPEGVAGHFNAMGVGNSSSGKEQGHDDAKPDSTGI